MQPVVHAPICLAVMDLPSRPSPYPQRHDYLDLRVFQANPEVPYADLPSDRAVVDGDLSTHPLHKQCMS